MFARGRGIARTAYLEDISGADCPIANAGASTPRHNGILFFQDVVGNPPSASNGYCEQHIRPYRQLADDLTADKVRGDNVLIPNLCHDMHSNDGPGSADVVKQGDDGCAANLPAILDAKVSTSGSALVAITWDEEDHANHPMWVPRRLTGRGPTLHFCGRGPRAGQISGAGRRLRVVEPGEAMPKRLRIVVEITDRGATSI